VARAAPDVDLDLEEEHLASSSIAASAAPFAA